ncbi:MAG: tungsten cofactor oxidoreductase radical SAM maturase [Chloroflexota bacterium]
MPKLLRDASGGVSLPLDGNAHPGNGHQAYWLDRQDGSLVLHPLVRDAQRVYLEPTTRCNLRCRTCIRSVWEDGEGHMAASTFDRFLAGLAELPEVSRVVFAGFGEPLSHPRLLDMVEAVTKRGLAVSIATNGLLLDTRLTAELVRLGVDRLVVSVDGALPETYADVRGADLARVVANLHILNETKRRLGAVLPLLGIEFVALRRNVHEVDALPALASELGADRIIVSNVLAYTAELREQALYADAEPPALRPLNWPARQSDFVVWGTMSLPRMRWGAERRCRFVGDRALVLGWDGAVSPCYALSHTYTYFAVDGVRKRVERYVLGNVNETSLADIWTSEEYVRYRASVRGFRFPSCPDCEVREGCDLRQRNLGCWGWSPSCADCLWAQDIVRCP